MPSAMTESPWPAVLDALEEQLRRQETALRGDSDAPGDLTLPLLEQPLPPDLAPRALSLLDRCRELQARAAEQVNRRRPPVRPYGGPGRAFGRL